MIFRTNSMHNIFGFHIFGITDDKLIIYEMSFSVYIPLTSFFSKDAMVGELKRVYL